jgi:hypothetical protein
MSAIIVAENSSRAKRHCGPLGISEINRVP